MLKKVYIEITNRCNLACPFCSKTERPLHSMTLEEFRRAASEAKKVTDYIYLHVKGEPTFHENFPDILKICKEIGLKVNITTNGTFINKYKDVLLNAGCVRQINYSVHGYNSKIHGPLNEWLLELKNFNDDFSRQGGYAVYRFWIMDKARHPEAGDRVAMEILDKLYGTEIPLEMQTNAHSVTLKKGVFVSFDSEFDWPTMSAPVVGDRGTCYGARSMLAILSDGTVTPCCLDAEGATNLGNIYRETMEEIMAGKIYTEMVEGFKNQKITAPLCKRCSYRLRFSKH